MTLWRTLPVAGFGSHGLVTNTKLRFPAHDVNRAVALVDKVHIRSMSYTLLLQVKEHPDITLGFRTEDDRDKAAQEITSAAGRARERRSTASRPKSPGQATRPALSSHSSGVSISSDNLVASPVPMSKSEEDFGPFAELSITQQLAPISKIIEHSKSRFVPIELLPHVPKPVNLPSNASRLRITPQHFVCLTIGSRGDIQPYIALCLELMKDGHTTTIVTHEEYKVWVEGYDIKHRTAGGDPGALMKLRCEPFISSVTHSSDHRPTTFLVPQR